MRGRTTALWVVWFFVNLAYYGAFTWMPTLLYLQGHSLVKSFEFTLMMTLAQLPGYAAAAWLIEKWGRRLTLSVFLCGSAVSAILFGLQSGATGIIVTGLLLSFLTWARGVLCTRSARRSIRRRCGGRELVRLQPSAEWQVWSRP